MIPDMGWHFLNGKIKGFDVRKPPILVYEHHGTNSISYFLERARERARKQPAVAAAAV